MAPSIAEFPWTKAGTGAVAFNTPYGRVGMLICKDLKSGNWYHTYDDDNLDLFILIAGDQDATSFTNFAVTCNWANAYGILCNQITGHGIGMGNSAWGYPDGQVAFLGGGERLFSTVFPLPENWTSNIQLLPHIDDNRLAVIGQRQTNTAWGLGPVNYMAGWTAQLFPGSGWMHLNILGALEGVSGCTAFGCGTGYKIFFQLYCDVNNVLAFGLIKDPGVAQMVGGEGVTIMIEGLADGQPVAGYWPLGVIDKSNSHNFYIEWQPSYIKFRVDDRGAHTYLQPMTVAQVSFSLLGAARLPGDAVQASFAVDDWSKNLGDLEFMGFTWDKQMINNTPEYIMSAFFEY